MRYGLLITVLALLCGCGLLPHRETPDRLVSTVVAEDFVRTLSAIQGYDPMSTVIQYRQLDSDFDHAIYTALQQAGYGLQLLMQDAEKKDNELGNRVQLFQNKTGETVAYEVSIGQLVLGREYENRAGRLFPLTAMSVHGAPKRVPVEPDQFDYQPMRSTNMLAEPQEPTPPLVVPDEPGARKWLAQRNMLEIGQSNFKELLQGSTKKSESLLIFPNDSLHLGKSNRHTIANLIDSIDVSQDMVSVIGCSHGKTAIDNGNEYLANGRANRVMEELVLHDIPREIILNEGCWDNRPNATMPARGVLLSIRQRL